MNQILLRYSLIPAAVLALVSIVRAVLEVQAPDAAPVFSASVLSMAWMLVVPALLLKRGVSLGQMLVVGLVFFVGHRLVIGAIYAMAWAGRWTVAGTDQPVRYVAQIERESPESSTMAVFLGNSFAPVVFGLVLLVVIWSVTWLIAFRRRPLVRARSGEPAARA